MLTGDSRTTATAVATKLGIDEVIAEVLPEDKSSQIKKLQSEGRFVAMAGDGEMYVCDGYANSTVHRFAAAVRGGVYIMKVRKFSPQPPRPERMPEPR